MTGISPQKTQGLCVSPNRVERVLQLKIQI
jgi:hypothetical protein